MGWFLVIALLRLQRAQRLDHIHLRLPFHGAEACEQMTARERIDAAMRLYPCAGDKEFVGFGLRILFGAVFLQRRRAGRGEIELADETLFRTDRLLRLAVQRTRNLSASVCGFFS